MKQNCTNSLPLRVLLVEDSIELQAMLQAMLSEIPSVEVIASVESENDALAVMRDDHTDLAIVDLELRSGTGLGVLKTCTTAWMGTTDELALWFFPTIQI